jgi:hypothetical protein
LGAFKRIPDRQIVGGQIARTETFVGHVSAGALDTGHPDETRKMLFVVPGVVIVDDVGGDIRVNDVQPSSWKFRAAAHITRQREREDPFRPRAEGEWDYVFDAASIELMALAKLV